MRIERAAGLVGETPSARPVRVMLVISNLGFGGAERQVLTLAEGLDRSRIEARICSLAPNLLLAEVQATGIPVHVITKRGRFDFGVVLRLARLLRQNRVDVVHAFLFDAEIASRLAARLAGVKAVLGSERGADYHVPWMHRVAFRLTRHLSSGLVANSEAGRRFSTRVQGLPDTRVSVVYNGVDTRRFAPRQVPELRRSLGIPTGDRVVGMVATFKRPKNHGMFFQMAARLLARHPSTCFVCVGAPLRDRRRQGDAYHREMLELVESLGIGERCRLLGSRGDVADLYNIFDVAVLTSSEGEGTPNTLLEAMASGVPVVVTDVADNAIHVPDGTVGFVVPAGDVASMGARVEQLLIDPPRRKAMGGAARRHVCEHYSVAAMTNSMATVYEGVLGRRSDAAEA